MRTTELNALPVKSGFRQRGMAMTRLEAFSDAAFAFAMTMLVISIGNIPDSYAELLLALKGIPTFAASFVSIMGFWMAHRSWSQRYGLEDMYSTSLTLLLIFVVLVYLYPLKIAFSVFFFWISGGLLPTEFIITSNADLIGVFIIYGLGLAALSTCLVLLNAQALRKAQVLKLNPLERIKTVSVLTIWSVMALTGLISALFALITPVEVSVYAGFIYFTLAFSMPITSLYFKKKIQNL